MRFISLVVLFIFNVFCKVLSILFSISIVRYVLFYVLYLWCYSFLICSASTNTKLRILCSTSNIIIYVYALVIFDFFIYIFFYICIIYNIYIFFYLYFYYFLFYGLNHHTEIGLFWHAASSLRQYCLSFSQISREWNILIISNFAKLLFIVYYFSRRNFRGSLSSQNHLNLPVRESLSLQNLINECCIITWAKITYRISSIKRPPSFKRPL